MSEEESNTIKNIINKIDPSQQIIILARNLIVNTIYKLIKPANKIAPIKTDIKALLILQLLRNYDMKVIEQVTKYSVITTELLAKIIELIYDVFEGLVSFLFSVEDITKNPTHIFSNIINIFSQTDEEYDENVESGATEQEFERAEIKNSPVNFVGISTITGRIVKALIYSVEHYYVSKITGKATSLYNASLKSIIEIVIDEILYEVLLCCQNNSYIMKLYLKFHNYFSEDLPIDLPIEPGNPGNPDPQNLVCICYTQRDYQKRIGEYGVGIHFLPNKSMTSLKILNNNYYVKLYSDITKVGSKSGEFTYITKKNIPNLKNIKVYALNKRNESESQNFNDRVYKIEIIKND